MLPVTQYFVLQFRTLLIFSCGFTAVSGQSREPEWQYGFRDGKAYLVSDKTYSYAQAKSFCRQRKAFIAEPKTKELNKILKDLVNDNLVTIATSCKNRPISPCGEIWIGIEFRFGYGGNAPVWESTSYTLNYTNWDVTVTRKFDLPDRAFLSFYRSGTWRVVPGGTGKKYLICEKAPDAYCDSKTYLKEEGRITYSRQVSDKCFLVEGEDYWTVEFYLVVRKNCFVPTIYIKGSRSTATSGDDIFFIMDACQCKVADCTLGPRRECVKTTGDPIFKSTTDGYKVKKKVAASKKFSEEQLIIHLKRNTTSPTKFTIKLGNLPVIVGAVTASYIWHENADNARPLRESGTSIWHENADNARPLRESGTSKVSTAKESFINARLTFCVRNLQRPFSLQVNNLPPTQKAAGTTDDCIDVAIQKEVDILKLVYREHDNSCRKRVGFFILKIENQNESLVEGIPDIVWFFLLGLVLSVICFACAYIILKKRREKRQMKRAQGSVSYNSASQDLGESSHATDSWDSRVAPVKEDASGKTKSSSVKTATTSTSTESTIFTSMFH